MAQPSQILWSSGCTPGRFRETHTRMELMRTWIGAEPFPARAAWGTYLWVRSWTVTLLRTQGEGASPWSFLTAFPFQNFPGEQQRLSYRIRFCTVPKAPPRGIRHTDPGKDLKDGLRLFAVDQDEIRLRLDILEKPSPTELFPEVPSVVTFISHTGEMSVSCDCRPRTGTGF